MAVDYRERLKRVYAAIHDDPARSSSLDEMAELAALSRFHFHRVFAAMTGETLAGALRRIRLNGAAHALVREDAPVAAIGRAHGYPSAAGFSRAFRAAYGVTPAQFRARGLALPAALEKQKGGQAMFPVEIRNEEPRWLIGLPHRGAYHGINRTYAVLGAELAARELWRHSRGMAAVYYDDPAVTPEADLRSFAAIAVPADVACPEPLQRQQIAGGRHAVMAFTGPYTGLGAAYDWLFGGWLAQSGAALRDAPSWELYLNSPMDTAPDALETLIFVPLEDEA
ncbi:AraC family transcriptional regulator [Pararhodobacter marinus]|uniref:AraC family transcriptional regulator n=1 Tax=Pararhodobacter marinus TaxID=2184063 RepID=UPI003517A4A6